MKPFALHITLLVLFFISGCTTETDKFVLSGELRFAGNTSGYVEIPPVHYKYAPKTRFEIEVNDDGQFSVNIALQEERILWLNLNGNEYPILASPGKKAKLRADLRNFPSGADIDGFGSEINKKYQSFLAEDSKLKEGLNNQAKKKKRHYSTIVEVHKLRTELAKQYFGDTPFQDIMYRTNGEYLINCLQQLSRKGSTKDVYLERGRQHILQQAHDLHFFSYESLKAQRAGIRGFTNAFAETHGIHKKYEEKYGQSLTVNDVRYLAYHELDSIKTVVMDYIYDIHALAHAEMYMVAERLGEAPFEMAEKTYFDYMQQFAGFPRYTSFLTYHYEKVKSVQPGQPTPEMTYPEAEGNTIALNSLQGKITMVKFWATWCANCRYQESYIKEIYDEYSEMGFEIYAVSIDENINDWLNEMQHDSKPWVSVYAGDGFVQESFMNYRAGSIPHFVLIDREGNILRNNDFRPSFNLADILDEIFDEEQVAAR